MKDAQLQAERLFARSFTKEKLEYLHAHPEFIEAARKVECLKDAVEAIDVGDRIIRRSFPWTSSPCNGSRPIASQVNYVELSAKERISTGHAGETMTLGGRSSNRDLESGKL